MHPQLWEQAFLPVDPQDGKKQGHATLPWAPWCTGNGPCSEPSHRWGSFVQLDPQSFVHTGPAVFENKTELNPGGIRKARSTGMGCGTGRHGARRERGHSSPAALGVPKVRVRACHSLQVSLCQRCREDDVLPWLKSVVGWGRRDIPLFLMICFAPEHSACETPQKLPSRTKLTKRRNRKQSCRQCSSFCF